jgi:hypothetical protein
MLERITHHGSIPNFGYETAEVSSDGTSATSAVCLKFETNPPITFHAAISAKNQHSLTDVPAKT